MVVLWTNDARSVPIFPVPNVEPSASDLIDFLSLPATMPECSAAILIAESQTWGSL